MESSPRAYGRDAWVWCVALAALLSSCSVVHRYHYDYTLKAPDKGVAGFIENDQVRVQVTPTEALGVVQLAVTNKSLEPVAVAWQESYFVNPHGHRHQAVNTDQGIIRAPDASMREGDIAPGATWRVTVQPGGAQATRQPHTEPSRYQADRRLPTENDQDRLSPVDRQLVFEPTHDGALRGRRSGAGVLCPALPAQSRKRPSTGRSLQRPGIPPRAGPADRRRHHPLPLHLRHHRRSGALRPPNPLYATHL